MAESSARKPEKLLHLPPKAAGVCACVRVETAGCKSPSRLGLNLVTESNCVAARRGGEQLEVNDQSAVSRT
jgi:hypothetical protein